MNLALCHAKEGKTASAWAEYTRAAELASRAGQPERERVARKGAADLEPVLSNLTLKSSSPDPVSVAVDGVAIGAASLGTPLPVDPGIHQITATADGRKPYAQSITVAPGVAQTVTIPPLERAAVTVAPAVTPAASPAAAPAPFVERYGHPVLGYVLVAGGAVAIVTGSVFGGLAFSKKSAAEQQCGSTYCTQAGLDDISAMKTSEAVSTIAIGAGLVAAGVGVYFVVRSGSHPSSEGAPATRPSARFDPLVGPRLGGLSLSGSF